MIFDRIKVKEGRKMCNNRCNKSAENTSQSEVCELTWVDIGYMIVGAMLVLAFFSIMSYFAY